MLSKKTMKIISIIIMVVMAVMMVSGVVFADTVDLIPEAKTEGNTVTKIKDFGGSIYGIFSAIGATVAVIILVWQGIKYIMASPDGKADIKKQAFGYILGAALVFGASTILPLIVKFITEAL